MATSYNNKIFLAGEFRKVEINAAGTISPGMLIEQTTADPITVQAATSIAVPCEKMFAEEDALQGRTTADNYVVTEPVSIVLPSHGATLLALLATGSSYTPGQKLISNGAGLLKATGTWSTGTIAINLATIDLTATTNSPTLSPVRII